MSFGTANIGAHFTAAMRQAEALSLIGQREKVAPAAKLPPAARHDCGSFGQLTVHEIVAISGLTPRSVYHRIKRGVRGADLCTPAAEFSGRFNTTIRHQCGRHGELTVREIAKIAGTSKAAIYQRLREGARGAALCKPRWANLSKVRRASPPRRHMLVCAMKIVARFPDRLPTLAEIKTIRPMSTQNARVWRQAIHHARAQLGTDA